MTEASEDLVPPPRAVRVIQVPSAGMADALQGCLNALSSIRRTYFHVLPRTAEWLRDEERQVRVRMKKFAERSKDHEHGTDFYVSDAHQVAELLSTVREMEAIQSDHILQTLTRSLFTQIFCELDSFTGALLTVIFTSKDELLRSITREVSFSELLQFESLDAVKLSMLEKEIETFRRDSYVEQFAALEKKFSFKTLRDFSEWGEFIELTQRRNLLIHNDGKVSEQYLLVCDREGHRFKARPRIGDVLDANPEYFARAVLVVTKVVFMLTHTLWKKLFPLQWEDQYMSLNDSMYKLLERKKWNTAAALADFALSDQMRKDVPEIHLRTRIVNCAIALKFAERPEDATKLLDSFDWSASYREFKLAIAVLKDDFENASKIMKEIGKAGEMVNEIYYHGWPLFHKFRETDQFQKAYEEIYGVTFAKKAVQDVRLDEAAIQTSEVLGLEDADDVEVVDVSKKPKRKPRSRKSD